MYAAVKIPLHSVANVLTLPVQAVQSAGEGKGTVLVVDHNNKIENRGVTLGLQSAKEVEITAGLQENETVIFGAQGQFKPGEVVSPKIVEPSGNE
jgi:multidrug efflux pump subunit AcrA (membrane-fusion protein)